MEQRKCEIKKKRNTEQHGRRLEWAEWNNSAPEHSSGRILHYRLFHVTFLTESVSEISSSKAWDLTDRLLHNDLFIWTTVPLGFLIKATLTANGSSWNAPASRRALLNPLILTDWRALCPGWKCPKKSRLLYENARISSLCTSAISHKWGVCGYKTCNIAQKGHVASLNSAHAVSFLHLSSFHMKLNQDFIQECVSWCQLSWLCWKRPHLDGQMKKQAYTVFGLFFHANPRFDTDLHNKGANLPILGCQCGNAACLRPLSHAVFLHIVLCSCEGGGGRTSLSGK